MTSCSMVGAGRERCERETTKIDKICDRLYGGEQRKLQKIQGQLLQQYVHWLNDYPKLWIRKAGSLNSFVLSDSKWPDLFTEF